MIRAYSNIRNGEENGGWRSRRSFLIFFNMKEKKKKEKNAKSKCHPTQMCLDVTRIYV